MNKQGFKGLKDQVVGSAKENLGPDATTRAEGTAQKIKGKVESGIANLRDKANK